MAGQARTTSVRKARPPEEHAEPVSPQDLLEDVDDMLDEIDAVLEKNAEEFVRNYRQKGGE